MSSRLENDQTAARRTLIASIKGELSTMYCCRDMLTSSHACKKSGSCSGPCGLSGINDQACLELERRITRKELLLASLSPGRNRHGS